MSKIADFVVVGSGGGGGSIAWVLAKDGFDVVLLEQGADWTQPMLGQQQLYDPAAHDEYRFRIERPEVKRRLRGDYSTFRSDPRVSARPFNGGWTGSQLGGGSVLWGGWGFRALPIDFVLRQHFSATGQLSRLDQWGYAVVDWPVTYGDMEPYYNLAETLFTVCGDRPETNKAIAASKWYQAFAGMEHFVGAGAWWTEFPFPQQSYPQVPSGELVRIGLQDIGRTGLSAPSSMIHPDVGPDGYSTRPALETCLRHWPGEKPRFWDRAAEQIWSDRVRDACTMCGFCGEFLCWGRRGPKSGTRTTMVRELGDLGNCSVRFNSKAYEITYDHRTRRGTGVRYLDLSDPDAPQPTFVAARHVIVSCGALQSARLLLMSGHPEGLGNTRDQVGRNATFHLFGLGASCTLPTPFQGVLRNELGHTGNTVSFDDYFLEDANGEWWKGGIVVSAAKKNPLEGAITSFSKGKIQGALLDAMEDYNRTVEIRITGDDLPMPRNRVDLDPHHVDEHGLPVARITRTLGQNEMTVQALAKPRMKAVFDTFAEMNGLVSERSTGDARVELTTDHQFGTCRMGVDPAGSVVDPWCRLHDVPNVFVVDSSIFPTGLGVNPMMTVVANALRVGTWITDNARRGDGLS